MRMDARSVVGQRLSWLLMGAFAGALVAALLTWAIVRPVPQDLVVPEVISGTVTLVNEEGTDFGLRTDSGKFFGSSVDPDTPGAQLLRRGAHIQVRVVHVAEGQDVVLSIHPHTAA